MSVATSEHTFSILLPANVIVLGKISLILYEAVVAAWALLIRSENVA